MSRLAVDATGAGLGLVADALLGEPPASVHPVALFGRSMQALERRWWADRRVVGTGHVAVGLGVAVAAACAWRTLLGRLVPSAPGRLLAVASATAAAAAGRALGVAALDVAGCLEAGDLEGARTRLPALVGRDPAGLDEAEIARAVVESVAENTVDAVVAPVLWAAVAGAPGAAAHRAVNTLDARVGYRSARYRRFGWASARMDDVANWIPARAVAAAVACCRPRCAGAVWRAVRRDASAHPSPNAGVAEAAFAAALGLRLGGPNRYGEVVELRPALGDGRPPRCEDIGAAVRLSREVAALVAGGLALVALVDRVAGRGRRGGRR